MTYLGRHIDLRLDPTGMLPGARSIIVVALNYRQPEPPPASDGLIRGRIARYAWGHDYHDVLRRRLHTFVAALRAELPEPFAARVCVDTAPLLERQLAETAGIGWIGKNTMVLHRDLGSYFVLGEIVTTLDLAPGPPAVDHCGTCTRCLDACPTRALVEPHVMDARRCIAYLTIEHRGEASRDQQKAIGDWLFGCDICQEVCPFNQRAPMTTETGFALRPPAPAAPVDEILRWTPEDYHAILEGSAIRRATLDMLQRNAEGVLRNRQGESNPTHES